MISFVLCAFNSVISFCFLFFFARFPAWIVLFLLGLTAWIVLFLLRLTGVIHCGLCVTGGVLRGRCGIVIGWSLRDPRDLGSKYRHGVEEDAGDIGCARRSEPGDPGSAPSRAWPIS